MQGVGESWTPRLVAPAAVPPSRPRHPTDVGLGTAQETKSGLSDSAQGLVAPR